MERRGASSASAPVIRWIRAGSLPSIWPELRHRKLLCSASSRSRSYCPDWFSSLTRWIRRSWLPSTSKYFLTPPICRTFPLSLHFLWLVLLQLIYLCLLGWIAEQQSIRLQNPKRIDVNLISNEIVRSQRFWIIFRWSEKRWIFISAEGAFGGFVWSGRRPGY